MSEGESTRPDRLAEIAVLLAPRSVGSVETSETMPGAFCETCDRNITDESREPHADHEVIDYLYGVSDDPIAAVLGEHWSSPIKDDDGRIMCRCCEWFDGPVYHRQHIAEQIRSMLRAAAGFSQEDTKGDNE